VFAQKLEQCAAQGRKAAVALVSIDNGQKLRDTYGQPVMDQLHCFVGNQWKKNFDTPAVRVVCRLTGSIFAVGCLDADGKQLAEEMQNLYRQMPRECITTTGMMRRVPFTLSCGAAGLEDVSAKNWQALYELCDARLREAQNAGGDQMRAE
jgi:diguanylate cyclase (GGDEF)-like protein